MIGKLAAFVLRVVEVALLCLAVVLLALALVQLSSALTARLGLTSVCVRVTSWLPAPLAYFGLLDCPLGGVFRTDYLIAAVVTLVIARLVRVVYRRLGNK